MDASAYVLTTLDTLIQSTWEHPGRRPPCAKAFYERLRYLYVNYFPLWFSNAAALYRNCYSMEEIGMKAGDRSRRLSKKKYRLFSANDQKQGAEFH